MYKYNDAEKAFDSLYDTIGDIISKCSDKIRITNKDKKIKPWITSGIIRSIRTRDKLAKLTKQDPTNTGLINKYKKYRNFLTHIIRQTKINYYSEKFSINKDDPKRFWKIINEATNCDTENKTIMNDIITDEGFILKNSQEIANEFNKHFTNVGYKITSKINKTCNFDHPPYANANTSSLYMFPVTEKEVISLVKGLKNNVAPGIDNITNKTFFFFTNKTLKLIIDHITKPLTHVLNLCISQGIFPSKLKLAVVTPLYKSGEKSDPNNYRPISLLPSLSKLCIRLCIF